jgi:eukaryotic-like serine/threonine-protein kinase
MNLQIGSTIGDYQIVGILGAGGMGKVYKVRNVISDRVEAMKVLLPDLVAQAELADRFLREIKVQASLEHPNISALHTAVRVDNQLLMLMEFVDGVTLEQRLRDGPIPVAQAVDYASQALLALEFAHEHGIIHRDIKPANMMLTPAGVVKLMDFGIAKAATDQRLTVTGTTMGSLYYMSPEQIQGANIDARADLYSLGVSLYELATGRRPFDGESQFAIMSAHLEKAPISPVAIDPKLPQALNDAILMSVAKDPAARFQTAAAFRNALANLTPSARPAASAITLPVPGPSPIPVAVEAAVIPRRPHGKRGLWMAAGALATAAAVITVVQLAPWKGTKAASQTPDSQHQAEAQTPPATAPPPQVVANQPAADQPAVGQSSVGQPSAGQPAAPPPQPVEQAQTAPPPANPKRPARRVQSEPEIPPVAQPVQPVEQPPAQAVTLPPPSGVEIQATQQRMSQLRPRIDNINNALSLLQTTQAITGTNLGARFTEPARLMNLYIKSASEALKGNDVDTAKSFLEKAENQVVILQRLIPR